MTAPKNEVDQLLEEIGLGHIRGAMDAFCFTTLADLVRDDGATRDAINDFIFLSMDKWRFMLDTAKGKMQDDQDDEADDELEEPGAAAAEYDSSPWSDKWRFLMETERLRAKNRTKGARGKRAQQEHELPVEDYEMLIDQNALVDSWSSNDDAADGRRCSNSKHSVWFPSIPALRPLSCFYKQKDGRQGLGSRCKDCTKYANKRSKKNKPTWPVKQKKRGRSEDHPINVDEDDDDDNEVSDDDVEEEEDEEASAGDDKFQLRKKTQGKRRKSAFVGRHPYLYQDAYDALKSTGRPMHYTEITRVINRGLAQHTTADRVLGSLSGWFSSAGDHYLTRPEPGTYALRPGRHYVPTSKKKVSKAKRRTSSSSRTRGARDPESSLTVSKRQRVGHSNSNTTPTFVLVYKVLRESEEAQRCAGIPCDELASQCTALGHKVTTERLISRMSAYTSYRRKKKLPDLFHKEDKTFTLSKFGEGILANPELEKEMFGEFPEVFTFD